MSKLCHHGRAVASAVTTFALAVASLAPGTVRAQTDSDCSYWHNEETDGPFTPSTIAIRLKGNVGPDMENRLFSTLEDNLTAYPTLRAVKLLLSSDGGYVVSGFRIHNYLRGLHERHGLQVITHNTGSVQSAAIDIYCSGNQRLASPYSLFMVHDSSREINGDYGVQDIQDFAEEDQLSTAASHEIFSDCTTLPVSEVAPLFSRQSYFDPDQALEIGLAHSIQPATFDRGADLRCLIEAEDDEESQE